MCLNPTIILNPRFSQHRHEFSEIVWKGKSIPQHKLSDSTYYPVLLPHAPNDVSKCDNTFAVTPDGVCVPIFMQVPCNKCLECVESKRSAIRTRMLLEQMSHNGCPQVFITLTYNDENLPSDGVSREDVRRFLNRFHLYLGRAGYPTYFRHVVFSEYGSLHQRPHYHGLLYGIDWLTDYNRLFFIDILEKAWSKGFVYVKIVDGSASKYVSKYVGKDVSFPVGEGKNPNFWTASRVDGGLGSLICKQESFLDLCATPEFPTVQLPVDGRVYTVTLPAYIRDKVLPALRHFVPRHVRMAYIRYRKNLCLLEALKNFGFDNDYLSYRCHEYLKQFNLPYSHDTESFDGLIHEMYREYSRADVSNLDPLLDHYHGSDFYWLDQFRDVSCKFFDLVAFETQLKYDRNILINFDCDVSAILTEILSRQRVSDRFSRKVEKYQSTLPPMHERESHLRSKNVKEFAMRVKDNQ